LGPSGEFETPISVFMDDDRSRTSTMSMPSDCRSAVEWGTTGSASATAMAPIPITPNSSGSRRATDGA
jgi:hypothetical protein